MEVLFGDQVPSLLFRRFSAVGVTAFLGIPGRKPQAVLEEKLKQLEEECRQKEAERVSLELELTEVKESLKKALAGGVTLGLAIEPKSGTSSPQLVLINRLACLRVKPGLVRKLKGMECSVSS
ncbi:hypothetical protein P7K49_006042 [Saguinus oedipus]|uniref:Uncharacterized protein n=1 Tax=Saguinus oedipus TaxID=9490 RepID=A0ABQ9W222_SAGOE|nr:hypothetical protein P7K49_006042 [Saguinus oedipus]